MTEPGNSPRRMLLLTGGLLGVFTSKTATSLVRYCPGEVVGVIDFLCAGGRLEQIIGCGEGVPVFADAKSALDAIDANVLVIGVAPVGGGLPEEWRRDILVALKAGLDVLAGLHVMLGEDEEFARAAASSGARIFDVRRPPDGIPVSRMRAADVPAFRVLTVGTDCSSGKMVTSLELTRAARDGGLDARFVATGQTGIMIAGKGIAVDRVISDFTAGAAERLALEDGDADILFIEGQGSLVHPGYSGVTLSLMQGAAPHAMVLCHVAGRTEIDKYERHVPLPSLPDMIALSEHAMRHVFPSRVVAVCLNTFGMSVEKARRGVDRAAAETALPATDVIRFGAEPVFKAVKEAYDAFSARRPQTDTPAPV
ncbi:MAG: DUF1611 domain-containing protein [Planctomycetota bacterium]